MPRGSKGTLGRCREFRLVKGMPCIVWLITERVIHVSEMLEIPLAQPATAGPSWCCATKFPLRRSDMGLSLLWLLLNNYSGLRLRLRFRCFWCLHV